jgi:hypothetical protein
VAKLTASMSTTMVATAKHKTMTRIWRISEISHRSPPGAAAVACRHQSASAAWL